MADKKVSIKVDVQAAGNIIPFAKEAKSGIDSLAFSLDKAVAKFKSESGKFYNPSKPTLGQKGYVAPSFSMSDFMGPGGTKTISTGFSMSDFEKPFKAPTGPTGPSTSEQFTKLGDGINKATLAIGAMQVAAVGFVAAASTAAFQTLTGSIQLAAGEIGIILIPAIVKVSSFFQDVAGTIQAVNYATGGLLGKMIGAIAVPLTIIALGGAAIGTTRWLYGLATSAFSASQALNQVAASGSMSALTGVGGKAASGLSGLAGSVMGKIGIGGAAVMGSQMLGGAIGGEAGGYVSSIGTGAAVGGTIGSFIPVIGTLIGAGIGGIVGAIYQGFAGAKKEDKMAALSLNFQPGQSSFEDFHEVIQREAMRDPMQQAQADQQARATQDLAREIGILSSTLGRDRPWQVGN